MKKQERKKRKSTQLNDLVKYATADLANLKNQELLTFKIPILLEYVFVFILSKRLKVAEDDLPNLDYGDLAALALSGIQYKDLLERVLKLGEVRNYLGHYLDRDAWLQKVREYVSMWKLPGPVNEEQLLLVYDLALSAAYIDVFVVAAKVVSADTSVLEQAIAQYREHQRQLLASLKRETK